MIKVSNLSKKYVGKPAVDNISFNVESGEIVGFLGPNGAGKTTTIRMLTGYIPPTSGTALIGGYDIFQDSINAKQKIISQPFRETGRIVSLENITINKRVRALNNVPNKNII